MKSRPSESCPFARNGIVEGLHQLTGKGGLLERAVKEQREGNALTRESNKLAHSNSKMLRWVIMLFLGSVTILLAVGGLAWLIFKDVVAVEQSMGKSIAQQVELVGDVKKLVTSQKLTRAAVDDAKKDLDAKPSLELVAEEDPEKAKEAPIKVRIIPPKSPKAGGEKPHFPAPTQTVVEVPFPMKDAKAIPKDD